MAEEHEQRRQRLANHEFGGTKGCYEQPVKDLFLLFASDAHRRHQEHLGKRECANQARDDAPAVLELRIIRSAGGHFYRRPADASFEYRAKLINPR